MVLVLKSERGLGWQFNDGMYGGDCSVDGASEFSDSA